MTTQNVLQRNCDVTSLCLTEPVAVQDEIVILTEDLA